MAKEQSAFRALVKDTSKFKPLKQVFAGFEIEKRQLLATVEKDHSKRGNAPVIYDEILRDGVLIDQGYVKDIQQAVKLMKSLKIELNIEDFKPNTIRLRRFGPGYKKKKISPFRYILTLKDRKETKKREVEFKLSEEQFEKYWPWTEGARVQKKRLKKKIKGFTFEFDAFIDRYLLIVECEVKKEKDMEEVPKLGMDITHLKDWSNKALSR